MSYKIDVSEIVRAHRKSLVNFNNGKTSGADKIIFGWLPLIVASIFVILKVKIEYNYVGIAISMLSIFVGLLLNMVVVLFDIIRTKQKRMIKVEVLEEVLANISFAIVLAIFTILTVLTSQISAEHKYFKEIACVISVVANFVSYAELVLFFATLLMVVSRMYNLFLDEIKNAKSSLVQEAVD